MTEGDLILFREGFLPTPSLQFTSEEWAHARARRLDRGDHLVEIRDGLGKSFLYQLSPNKKELFLVEEKFLIQRLKALAIAIALPKGNRLDFFLQKATEIGISKIFFCEFEHSVRKEFNIERAKKIVSEAASQSKQPDLLQMDIVTAMDWLKENKTRVLILDPHADQSFQSTLLAEKIPVIGPEGGFSKSEILKMDGWNLERVRLDGGILRTETAGIVAASLLAYGT